MIKRASMTFEDCIDVIEMLSHSQGFYGRLLEQIDLLDDIQLERLCEEWEGMNFSDTIDFIMYLEC